MHRRAELFNDVVRHWGPAPDSQEQPEDRKWPGADQRRFNGQGRHRRQAFSWDDSCQVQTCPQLRGRDRSWTTHYGHRDTSVRQGGSGYVAGIQGASPRATLLTFKVLSGSTPDRVDGLGRRLSPTAVARRRAGSTGC
jgi:hypothetical protein